MESLLKSSQEGVELAEDVGAVGEVDVVVGVGEDDDAGGGDGFLEGGDLGLGQGSQGGGVGLGGLADCGVGGGGGPRSEGVRHGKDGESGGGDRCELWIVFQERAERRAAGKAALVADAAVGVALTPLLQLAFGISEAEYTHVVALERVEAGEVGGLRWRRLGSVDGHELLHRGDVAVVEGVGIGGVEINDAGDAMRMLVGDGAEFGAADGVADEHGMVEMQRVEKGDDVVGEMARVVVGGGCVGGAESAARDGVDVVGRDERGREVVEGVGGVAASGEEDEWAAGAAPVEDFEADGVGDGHEELFVRGWVGARRGGLRLCGRVWSDQRERGDDEERGKCGGEAHECLWWLLGVTTFACEMFRGNEWKTCE
jgi:hypothetical protein